MPLAVRMESIQIESSCLLRTVQVDLYLSTQAPLPQELSLLLINGGQDLKELGLADMLEGLFGRGLITPLLCAGIHAARDRKMEYGTAAEPDYLGRGAGAKNYQDFTFIAAIS